MGNHDAGLKAMGISELTGLDINGRKHDFSTDDAYARGLAEGRRLERERIRAALLSDEAVEAACKASINTRFAMDHDFWQEALDTPVADADRIANGIHFDIGTPDAVRRQESAALNAALAAVLPEEEES